MVKTERLAPVLVLSTGRCGSTMISQVLNTHPEVLSLSEFFISLGMKALIRKRLSGKALWGICCRHSPGLKAMLAGSRDRILYPFDTPQARYSPQDIPSILCVALPHLTPDYERLFEELGPVVRGGRGRPWPNSISSCSTGCAGVWNAASGSSARAARYSSAVGSWGSFPRRGWSTSTATDGTRRCP